MTGLVLGALYAMIALGYTMVYGVLQLLNFAHSEVFMVGSFGGLYAFVWLGVDEPLSGIGLVLTLLFAFAVAMVFAGVTAVAMERIAYRPLRRRGASRLTYLIAAIGVSLFLSNLFLLLDGERHLGLPFDWPAFAGRAPIALPPVLERQQVFSLLGVSVTNIQVLILLVAVGMMFVLDLFVRRTKVGMGIRAVAEDPETASMMGVSITGIVTVTFLMGGLMAGGAGLLYGMNFGVTQFNVGFIPGIKAFTAAVLGGIGNIRGAMLGGLVLGLVENLGIACVSAQWRDVIAFTVLVLVLMFRPTGLLGEQVGG
ncbi:MAG TPA: branched-chain amino acid ABC transporter permease [Actinomycetota bacterium]|nr:branched-chain amino acid ABC transporter permease [Actinomycetota bacterium]